MTTITAAVVVLGLGPAGRAVTSRLVARGVDVVAVEAAPDRVWTATYAAWAREVPDWLPAAAVSTRTAARAYALTEHRLDDGYVVFDTSGLQQALPLTGARVVTGTVATAGRHRVVLTDGRSVSADVVLDARGSPPTTAKAQQTAVGVVVPADRTGSIEGTWFMDWRRDNDAAEGALPSFLYAVPLDADRVLLEETCLVGRPALGYDELRRRLRARLSSRGVRLVGDEPEERVRFAVEPEPAAGQGLTLGARGGVMHPATGYSVAPSLRVAERVAEALAAGAAEVGEVVWNRRARRVRTLRQIGLTTLLRLPPEGVAPFFESFFRLPPRLQHAYLSGREEPVTTLAAMAAMALTLRPSLSRVAVGSALLRG